jgi:hypothetical protein
VVILYFYVEPRNTGGDRDPRGAHIQSISQDAGVPPTAMNLWKL